MEAQNMKLLKMISDEIRLLYELHDYSIEKDKLLKIARIIYSTKPSVVNEYIMEDFFLKV